VKRLSVASILIAWAAAGQVHPPARATTDQRIESIQRQLKQSPRDAALLNELSGAYLQKMRETADGSYLDRATRIVSSVLAADPSCYDARKRQIEIELQRHRFANAIAQSRTLVKERPDDPAVWSMMGDAFMETGDYDGAADAYQRAVDLRPNLATYNRVAFYRFVTGDAEGAIDTMRLAVRTGSREPENVAWCLADLGRMLLKTGATDEAESAFRQALAIFPGYHPAIAGLGRVQAARGSLASAVRSVLDAQRTVPLPEYAGLLATWYRKMGKADEERRQIELLDVADKLDQAAGESANRTLSLAFSTLGHHLPRALELARAELKIRQDVYTYDALGWALFQNGKLDEAAEAMRKALSQNSPEPAFHQHAAAILNAIGRTGESTRHAALGRSGNWE
jgi:Flp pilus assembly protein TadD